VFRNDCNIRGPVAVSHHIGESSAVQADVIRDCVTKCRSAYARLLIIVSCCVFHRARDRDTFRAIGFRATGDRVSSPKDCQANHYMITTTHGPYRLSCPSAWWSACAVDRRGMNCHGPAQIRADVAVIVIKRLWRFRPSNASSEQILSSLWYLARPRRYNVSSLLAWVTKCSPRSWGSSNMHRHRTRCRHTDRSSRVSKQR
jgi:hypothetical protein